MRTARAWRNALWLLVLILCGCAGHQQSVVDAAGAPAAGIEKLWWVFFWLLLAIFILVMAILGASVTRRNSADVNLPPERVATEPASEKRLTRAVGIATAATVVILLALLAASIATGRVTDMGRKPAMVIEVTGNQWWWQIRYLNDDPSRIVVTANEIHIPVGEPVMIREMAQDVIHSFWVPNLQGKRDLIPSRVTTDVIEADRPGRFRGQCAEFCGLQHAHMAIWVVAEPRDKFAQWMDAQLQPAATPTDPAAMKGQQVFMNNACVLCHNISGTPASGQAAPDLTHVGSRLTIAAGTLPNNLGNMAGWITDPQAIKPGNHMATVPLEPEDVQPLAAYLESLR